MSPNDPGPASDSSYDLPTPDSRLANLVSPGEVSPRREALHRAADATRRVIHSLAGTEADSDHLDRAAAAISSVADDLAQFPNHSMHGFAEAANSGDPHGFFDHSPVLGRANPLAAPLVPQLSEGNQIIATAVYGSAYEGPPGCIHGGYIAAAFDEVLGLTQSLSGQHGMTGGLTITYRSPTPLHEEVRFTGLLERVEGRKIFTTGTLHAGERLCAEASAVFITVDFSRLAEMREGRTTKA